LPTTSYPIIIIIVTNQPSNHHYSQPAIDSPLGPPKKEAVLAVLWVGSWVFFASFLLSQVPEDYTPSAP
jgi:hypothetical protein